MASVTNLRQQLFKVKSETFTDHALSLFKYQSKNNKVYRKYIEFLGIRPAQVGRIEEIPFLPIQFFKDQQIRTGKWKAERTFESSGTTGQVRSQHLIRNMQQYRNVCVNNFKLFYGDPGKYHIMALLPSYLEQKNSSLVSMVQFLIEESRSELSGFYLDDHEYLVKNIMSARRSNNKRIILFGVTFALIELAERYKLELNDLLIIETGGMKGRREELTRSEVHNILKRNFRVPFVHSEYGMTELLSQAYSKSNGIFNSPPWMKVLFRDITDPFQWVTRGWTGGINVIDLANIDSCGFIETMDMGRQLEEGFEVLGRIDNSDIRGCNLLVG